MIVPEFTHGLFKRMRERRKAHRIAEMLKLIEAIQRGASLFMNPLSAKLFSESSATQMSRMLGVPVYFTPFVEPGSVLAAMPPRSPFAGFPDWSIETKLERQQ